ncbi:MAG: ATP-binding protein, partial [Candidatus Woesearchaeota archaeon]
DLIYYVLEFVTLGIASNKLLLMSSSIWYCGNEVYEQLSLLKKLIIQNFVISLNTLDNIIIYGNTGIETRQKIKVDYEINQFDVYKLAEEIKSVINKKRKRGYIFAGVPGTGKSSILLKLEGLLTEFPILYISKSAINYSGDMNAAFDLIITLSPCIVIFEDLDCFGFSNKNTRLFNEFLQEIDNVYENFHSVIIATINNASEVHHSLINRPGRFDQVFMISPPQSLTEVFKVMDNKFNKTTGEHIYMENINKNLLQSIIDNKFTQADICEIIEKILINDKEFNNESLKYSISELMASKEAIKNCSFNKEVLIEYDDYYD